MKYRIIGFDLARAYAIFGMFIVNFNTVFGSHTDHSGLSGLLNAFNGNSSSLFVMLAGMGVSLMTNRNKYSLEERNTLKRIITKRSWFLFGLGITFYVWWPADILHFYGGYMHIAVLFLFLPKKYYLYAAFFAIVIFHLLLTMIPYETGWDFKTFMYDDFWTVPGFIRNTFYNGWNSIFPWIAYFFLGMYAGRMNWKDTKTPKRVLVAGVPVYIFTYALQFFAPALTNDRDILHYLTADYLPPFLPFMVGTAAFGMIVISLCSIIGNTFGETELAKVLAATGQMTLTHYITHLTLGFFILSVFAGKKLSYELLNETPTPPLTILLFAIVYFSVSCLFSYWWTKNYKNGPLEMVMRKLAG